MRILIEVNCCGVTTPDGRVCWLAKGIFGKGLPCELVIWTIMTDAENPTACEELKDALPTVTHLHDNDGQGDTVLKTAFMTDNTRDGLRATTVKRPTASMDDAV